MLPYQQSPSPPSVLSDRLRMATGRTAAEEGWAPTEEGWTAAEEGKFTSNPSYSRKGWQLLYRQEGLAIVYSRKFIQQLPALDLSFLASVLMLVTAGRAATEEGRPPTEEGKLARNAVIYINQLALD